jgi:hypothetical protein
MQKVVLMKIDSQKPNYQRFMNPLLVSKKFYCQSRQVLSDFRRPLNFNKTGILCDTGTGNFCEAFGIPAITVSTNFFATAGVESRAFVGMKSWNININFVSWESYSLMTGFFLADWLSGNDVQTCVGNAKNDAHITVAEMSSSAVIYGAYDLRIGTITRPH